MWELDGF